MNETVAKPKLANKYKFVFANGDVITKESDYGIDDVVLQVYVARLNSGKSKRFCSIFAAENGGEFQPVKKAAVTIPLQCLN